MTITACPKNGTMTDDSELSDEDVARDELFLPAEQATPDEYPRLWNPSAAHLFRAVVRAEQPAPAEYVTVPIPNSIARADLSVAVAQWNVMWEAAQFRRYVFDDGDLPDELRKVADSGDVNVVFVPRTRTRYYEYAPLFHLLPRATAERFGLPLLRRGQWPFLIEAPGIAPYLPADFDTRFSRAWASVMWRHLMPGSPMSGFTRDDPIRLLAHNMDFWVPPVTEVVQDILREMPEVDNGIEAIAPPLTDGTFLDGAIMANPRMGSDLWRGEEEAAEALVRVVEAADAAGRLRGILEAVRTNRVEDDFSDRWTYAREDFERKLYRKRSKIKVRFVELTDTILVQGPDTEVEGRMVTADFLALFDKRDQQVIVLLNSGVTNLTEVAGILGYRNHSAVSKRLKRIRAQAARFFGEP